MANEDLINNSIIDGKQTITTHTVGFNIDDPWLQRIASGNIGQEGAGNYFTANSTEQLVTALVDIIVSSERRVESTLVAPGVTVDQFSRLSHRKDTYLALFEPSDNPQWPGNMKRYDLFGGALFDASEPPIAAVDNTTGRFNPNSRSFWSNDTDGHDITAGGARSQLPTHTFRNAVTYTGSDDSLLHSTNAIATVVPALLEARVGQLIQTPMVDTTEDLSHTPVSGPDIHGGNWICWKNTPSRTSTYSVGLTAAQRDSVM